MALDAPCPSCGAALPASGRCRDRFDELSAYTLTRAGGGFIHQHAVDAYAAQHAAENPKPVATAAGLIGLHLFAEKGWNGRRVQQAHMELGNRMKEWPAMPPPGGRAALTITDVLAAPEGPERDRRIEDWARAVWAIWSHEHGRIAALLEGPYRLRGK